MFCYFGFASNLNQKSLRAKGVEPLAAHMAVLPGWRLRFNVQHFFRHEGGVGNIERSENPADKVLGVLYECPDESLSALDAMEACGHGYDRITVDVLVNGHSVSAFSYVGMPEFINDQCLPSRRYLNIVTTGARQAGLDADYVQHLEAYPVHPMEDYPLFTPPPGEFPLFNSVSLKQYPLYTSLWGAVFDMSLARPLHHYLKEFFGGRDMTLFHLKRLDTSTSDESMEDIRLGRLNEAQRRYLNAYLHEYAREYHYVGRFDYSLA